MIEKCNQLKATKQMAATDQPKRKHRIQDHVEDINETEKTSVRPSYVRKPSTKLQESLDMEMEIAESRAAKKTKTAAARGSKRQADQAKKQLDSILKE